MKSLAALALPLLAAAALAAQTPKPVPLAQGRAATPGVTRVTQNDTDKATVVKVTFAPGAFEPPHTHPYDVVVVPLMDGPAELVIGDEASTELATGKTHYISRGAVHSMKNTGTTPIEFISIAVK